MQIKEISQKILDELEQFVSLSRPEQFFETKYQPAVKFRAYVILRGVAKGWSGKSVNPIQKAIYTSDFENCILCA